MKRKQIILRDGHLRQLSSFTELIIDVYIPDAHVLQVYGSTKVKTLRDVCLIVVFICIL